MWTYVRICCVYVYVLVYVYEKRTWLIIQSFRFLVIFSFGCVLRRVRRFVTPTYKIFYNVHFSYIKLSHPLYYTTPLTAMLYYIKTVRLASISQRVWLLLLLLLVLVLLVPLEPLLQVLPVEYGYIICDRKEHAWEIRLYANIFVNGNYLYVYRRYSDAELLW